MTKTSLIVLLLLGSPGEAWEPCREGECATKDLTCYTTPAIGADICVPGCETDGDCLGYDPEPPQTDAGVQCSGGLCVLQCGIGPLPNTCPAGSYCLPDPLGDTEGVCFWPAS